MDDAVNFGGLGASIGHELAHDFDNHGREFDAEVISVTGGHPKTLSCSKNVRSVFPSSIPSMLLWTTSKLMEN
jgi:hypothetical protein